MILTSNPNGLVPFACQIQRIPVMWSRPARASYAWLELGQSATLTRHTEYEFPRRIPAMSDRIVMRTGECLLAGGPPFTAAEPEVVIGELDGPVGTAIATLTGNQAAGHSKVFAILDTDIQVRPVTLMVSKVTVKSTAYTNILMGTVQGAIANGVLDAVRAGDIPKDKANDLGIVCSVWLNPGAATDKNLDHKALFEIHRKATAQAIHKAMNNEPSIDWLLEHQDEITHKYYERGLKGEI